MDTNKKILIGAGAAVVIGGVAFTGLLLSKTPEKADLSTIHTEAFSRKLPRKRFPPPHRLRRQRRPQKARKTLPPVSRTSIETYIRKGIYPVSCGGPDG